MKPVLGSLTDRPCVPFCPGTTFGRYSFAPRNVAEICGETAVAEFGVYTTLNAVPACIVLIPLTCHPPSTVSTKAFASFMNLHPRPKGSSYTRLVMFAIGRL